MRTSCPGEGDARPVSVLRSWGSRRNFIVETCSVAGHTRNFCNHHRAFAPFPRRFLVPFSSWRLMQRRCLTRPYEAAYKLMIGSVVPRPIAWLTTVSPDGIVNAAPFSAYTILCIRPPMVIVNCARRDGASKDTACNAATSADFVLNVRERGPCGSHAPDFGILSARGE
ncbi:flavin reductase family protein [Bradyrhizobium sp. STM 3561]|uniref:flavin reductase family protein n=1 Tax=Bradyrhizobium sp. STM 3561 TaxID=578923 RepID=UPI00388E8ABE